MAPFQIARGMTAGGSNAGAIDSLPRRRRAIVAGMATRALRAVPGRPGGRTLVLEVTFFEEASEGLARSVAALGAAARRRDIEVRQVTPETARRLVTWPMIALLRTLRRGRPASVTALAAAVGRPAAGVRRDLALLEQLGIVALREPSRKGALPVPELRYAALQLRIDLQGGAGAGSVDE